MVPQTDSKDSHDQSLTSILDHEQCTGLTLLLANASSRMRKAIEDTFDASASTETKAPPPPPKDELVEIEGSSASNEEQKAKDEEERRKNAEKEKALLIQREQELSAPKMKELKDAALKWFDEWRAGVMSRVGEVVNSRPEGETDETQATKEKSLLDAPVSEKIESDVERIHKSWPPIDTPLTSLPRDKRLVILSSTLLLLLSLEHYQAPSRVLLLHLTSSLNLPESSLYEAETKVAISLLEGAKQLSGSKEQEKAANDNAVSRKWKVGIAGVAGAAVIGITGGLAAPLVAAGIGSVLGGIGLGTTAVAGYLGAMAGSSVLVGGLFGAYGGKMTSRMMDAYAKEVEDFAFIPINGRSTTMADHKNDKARSTDPEKVDPQSRRLRVSIGVSGWLTKPSEVYSPWLIFGNKSSEPFSLRYDLEALLNLGNSIFTMLKSYAWGYAKKEIIARTIFADLMLALWPVGLLKISRVVDNPFSVAKSRADKAGVVLADAIINRAQGERPVSLVGYSLGARLIYRCLLELARRRAFGLIEDVVLMGAPCPSQSEDWRAMRAVASGRIVNVYSENDFVLAFLYRTSSVQLGIAGLQAIEGVKGVENLNVSEKVDGHMRYRYLIGGLLKDAGWQDINEEELERELEAMKVDEEKVKGDESVDTDDHDEGKVEEMEKEIQSKTDEDMVGRRREKEQQKQSPQDDEPESEQPKQQQNAASKMFTDITSSISAPKWPFGKSS